ncbi:type VII secretion-associated serine protease mycosin [Actinoplanes sp. NPDC051633]|uniref:type VII secretion-associated serine protease mycosin n=1 Tax=Actinoplanes sp. NPDC051633 TaxID=3155670 RepID=UPI00341EB2E5
MVRRVLAGVAALAVVLLPAPASARARATPCDPPPAPGQVFRDVPFEQKLYDLSRIAPLSTGAGVRVAVIDSGVDAGHPQLRGRVDRGRDLLHNNPDARQDCVGHGTAVASIIAARQVERVAFQGLAPGATIVPVRITEKEEIGGQEVGDDGTPAEFAEAIRWAASKTGGNARVINLSVVMTKDNAEVRRAVAQAVAGGVVVVAAAGNNGDESKGNPVPYPAAYSGVIGVGAVGPDGTRASFSQHGQYVDLVAAGLDVTAAAPVRGHTTVQGTSFAAPFVSATAALILQRLPTLTPAQVQRRLIVTADPAPGGRRSDEYGFGLLNPYRALTETLPVGNPSPAPTVLHTEDPAALALAARRHEAQDRSMIVGAAGLGLAVLGGIAVAAIRRGRRRGWRPAGR